MSVVAIVDSGVNLSHRDLVDKLWVNSEEIAGNGIDDDGNGAIDDIHGFDTFESGGLRKSISNYGDPQGHGTHVAGIVSTLEPNARIMPIRMLDANGDGLLSDALFAWSYALENGAKVINNSFGIVGSPASEFSFMEEAVRFGKQKYGAIFISAAGNQGNNNDLVPCTPANVPGMISVGATSLDGGVATFSNYGNKTVHLFAPGENILSADAFSLTGRSRKSGTSQAAPMVSAMAASVFVKKPKSKLPYVEKKLFKQLKYSSMLDGKSTSGSAISAKYTKKIVRMSGLPRARRAERDQVSGGLVNYGRFVGVLDEAKGMNQQDVVNLLNCHDVDYVEDIEWPLDNIAVFSLEQDAVGRTRHEQNSRSSQRVLQQPRRSKPQKALKTIQNLDVFKSLEWDAFVTQMSSDMFLPDGISSIPADSVPPSLFSV